VNRIILAMTLALAVVCAGCASTLPKPVNANGSVNPSVAVAKAEVHYANIANDIASYKTTCHANMATVGCSASAIAALDQANEKAWAALQAAENAVRTMPAGSAGIDQALAYAQAALAFLQSLDPKH
jgi:hypothetical protein